MVKRNSKAKELHVPLEAPGALPVPADEDRFALAIPDQESQDILVCKNQQGRWCARCPECCRAAAAAGTGYEGVWHYLIPGSVHTTWWQETGKAPLSRPRQRLLLHLQAMHPGAHVKYAYLQPVIAGKFLRDRGLGRAAISKKEKHRRADSKRLPLQLLKLKSKKPKAAPAAAPSGAQATAVLTAALPTAGAVHFPAHAAAATTAEPGPAAAAAAAPFFADGHAVYNYMQVLGAVAAKVLPQEEPKGRGRPSPTIRERLDKAERAAKKKAGPMLRPAPPPAAARVPVKARLVVAAAAGTLKLRAQPVAAPRVAPHGKAAAAACPGHALAAPSLQLGKTSPAPAAGQSSKPAQAAPAAAAAATGWQTFKAGDMIEQLIITKRGLKRPRRWWTGYIVGYDNTDDTHFVYFPEDEEVHTSTKFKMSSQGTGWVQVKGGLGARLHDKTVLKAGWEAEYILMVEEFELRGGVFMADHKWCK